MKALVTGGAGFIGSHLCRALLKEGHQVRVLDNLSTGSLDNLADIGGEVELMVASVADPEACRSAVEGVQWVFHLAAIPSVPLSVEDPLGTHHVNATGTLNLLTAARDAKVKRLVYSASSAAYGDAPVLPKREDQTPCPQSPYAVQKVLGEYYISNYFSLYGFEAVSLRYFNVFGPRQDPNSPYGAVIPKFISALLAGKTPMIFGDGRQSRDFIYVENAVHANLLAAKADRSAMGQVYNVACGQSYDLLELLESLYTAVGTRIEPIFAPARAGDVAHSCADIARIADTLGYRVQVPFGEGLARTVQWYREGH